MKEVFFVCIWRFIGVKRAGVYSLHSLLENRVPSGLADDQICPLYYYNTGEERRVARKLHNLSLLVCLRKHRI